MKNYLTVDHQLSQCLAELRDIWRKTDDASIRYGAGRAIQQLDMARDLLAVERELHAELADDLHSRAQALRDSTTRALAGAGCWGHAELKALCLDELGDSQLNREMRHSLAPTEKA